MGARAGAGGGVREPRGSGAHQRGGRARLRGRPRGPAPPAPAPLLAPLWLLLLLLLAGEGARLSSERRVGCGGGQVWGMELGYVSAIVQGRAGSSVALQLLRAADKHRAYTVALTRALPAAEIDARTRALPAAPRDAPAPRPRGAGEALLAPPVPSAPHRTPQTPRRPAGASAGPRGSAGSTPREGAGTPREGTGTPRDVWRDGPAEQIGRQVSGPGACPPYPAPPRRGTPPRPRGAGRRLTRREAGRRDIHGAGAQGGRPVGLHCHVSAARARGCRAACEREGEREREKSGGNGAWRAAEMRHF